MVWQQSLVSASKLPPHPDRAYTEIRTQFRFWNVVFDELGLQ